MSTPKGGSGGSRSWTGRWPCTTSTVSRGTSLRAIGEAIGLSHAALRHYFVSREQLLVEVLREADRRAIAFAEQSGEGAVGFLLRGADYNMAIPGLVALYQSMVAHALEPGSEFSKSYFVERYAHLRRSLVVIFEAARADGTMRADVPLEAAAALVLAACDGLGAQSLLDPAVPMCSAPHLLDTLLGVASTD